LQSAVKKLSHRIMRWSEKIPVPLKAGGKYSDEKRILPAQLIVSGPGNADSHCLPTDPLTDGNDDHPGVEVVIDKSRH
jgi:hypothetical protein